MTNIPSSISPAEQAPLEGGEAPLPTQVSAGQEPAAQGKGDVGNALRSIYQQTVEEDVPDEMIDLLGRLG